MGCFTVMCGPRLGASREQVERKRGGKTDIKQTMQLKAGSRRFVPGSRGARSAPGAGRPAASIWVRASALG